MIGRAEEGDVKRDVFRGLDNVRRGSCAGMTAACMRGGVWGQSDRWKKSIGVMSGEEVCVKMRDWTRGRR